MTAKSLMVQGTSSHCGKSLLVAAFCKIFSDAGYKTAPFKGQNMSLNSYVTEEGTEIARAQALQAYAAGIETSTDMNPILLKPKGNMVSQVVLKGKHYKDMKAEDYYRDFVFFRGLKEVKASLEKLLSAYEIVLIEGAGSPVEINLYDVDITNMQVADLAEAPVILVTDIDRGGSFASLLGTLELLKPKHRRRIKGFVFNKFRGELSLLQPGLVRFEEITGIPVLGVVPYIEDLKLPTEDSVSLDEPKKRKHGVINIAVIRLPKISNSTDFDPLKLEVGVEVQFIKSVSELDKPDLVILPGTKNTVQDLLWLERTGFAKKLMNLAELGIPLMGICGGYQMLGKKIIDEKGVEDGDPGEYDGLNLLDTVTRFDACDKVTQRVTVQVIGKEPIINSAYGEKVSGYQIHMGTTILGPDVRPIFKLNNQAECDGTGFEGSISKNGLILGTYLHGVFDDFPIRKALINFLCNRKNVKSSNLFEADVESVWTESLEKLAETVKRSLNIIELCKIIDISPSKG
ncbi:MAG: cobyric acid synthase [Candidatus Bathyarchaeota archaeon]